MTDRCDIARGARDDSTAQGGVAGSGSLSGSSDLGGRDCSIGQGGEGRGYAPESFFQNRACRYFPCHKGVAADDFNCLFCYCPLYALGSRCGGDFSYTDAGLKDCSGCTLPHRGDAGARLVKERFSEIAELAGKRGGLC